ncbi:MAG: hypothetical protein J6334_10775 [Kiritimatiellae bacterium]|nr:hypothetical protein [Kiritimatiellia bacterium]
MRNSDQRFVPPAPSGGGKGKAKTMPRLKGFDYTRPFFYMVTLKRLPGLAAFSQITEEAEPPPDERGRSRYLITNAITGAFERVIQGFAGRWWGLWPIECFVIMPDHIHLLLHIKDTGDQMALGRYVYQLMKALAGEYWRLTGQAPQNADDGMPPVFEQDWHEWIVKRDGQLAAFTRYIRENPERAWLRRTNRHYFGAVKRVSFLGREWFAYGNTALLDLPVLVAVKGHRATREGSPEWDALVEACARIGPGGAGVGTFMSPLEKACGNAIAGAGGRWIVLSPEGFHVRWHPPREQERFCAEGRMLFLSLYAAMDRLPTKRELYLRCHEMGDLAAAGLPAAR